jgi:hypothetical protein
VTKVEMTGVTGMMKVKTGVTGMTTGDSEVMIMEKVMTGECMVKEAEAEDSDAVSMVKTGASEEKEEMEDLENSVNSV